MYHTNSTNHEKTGVVLLIQKVDTRKRSIIENKRLHFIMIKGSIHHKGVQNLNVHAHNNRNSKCMECILIGMKKELNSSTFVILYFLDVSQKLIEI